MQNQEVLRDPLEYSATFDPLMDAHSDCASKTHTHTHVCTHALYTHVHTHTHTPPQRTDDYAHFP